MYGKLKTINFETLYKYNTEFISGKMLDIVMNKNGFFLALYLNLILWILNKV